MFSEVTQLVQSQIRKFKAQRALAEVLKSSPPNGKAPLTMEDWGKSLRDPTGFYLDAVRAFHSGDVPLLTTHRNYFRQKHRGYSEDASHWMWWMIFSELRPQEFLEIGVYRGQMLSLAALLQKHFSISGHVVGISPFAAANDGVSRYREDVDYLQDTLKNFEQFHLEKPELVKAYSTDPIARQRIAATSWDCIYIDGNHDYEVVVQDWQECSRAVKEGGIIVLDDAARDTSYRAPGFASPGHPGPSRLALEIDPSSFTEILHVGHNRVFRKKVGAVVSRVSFAEHR